jgi:predicted  nucleic acid-binding Zn-ribbon protein
MKVIRGFVCSTCRTRLQVARTVNPCTGRVVRYRKCPKCGCFVVTEERERSRKLSISATLT